MKYYVCDGVGNVVMETEEVSKAINFAIEYNQSLSDEECDDVEKTYFVLDENDNAVQF